MIYFQKPVGQIEYILPDSVSIGKIRYLSGMELRHLLYFKTVAEQLHFRKAASILFISQPPLSRQIRELEHELGVLLFTRKDKRVGLTDAGKYFKTEVDAIFARLEESKATVREIHNSESGELKIGYISSVYQSRLADALRSMRDVFPHFKTNLFEMPTPAQVSALEEGSLDVGILRGPVQSHRLEQKTRAHMVHRSLSWRKMKRQKC